MKILYRGILIVLLAPAVFMTSFAGSREDETKPIFEAKPIERPLQLTGSLNDPLWQNAAPVQLSYEIQPGENTGAPQRTMALALFDQENLYFGFRCYDTRPHEIRANLTDRDKIFQDDYIIVIFDTYGDCQRAYELAVNPYGIQGDLMRTSNNEDESFDIIWRSAATKNDSGWTAELAIPFKSLRFDGGDEQQWIIHLIRNYPRASRVQTSWVPIDRNNPNFLNQGGLLRGMSGIESGGSVELLPYILGQQTGEMADVDDPLSNFQNNKIQGRIGGGVQYSPGPNFSLDAVLNPDFSQIETDADQISVNTTFALFYPEKRPFFLIGQELLQTPMYYSRSINNPLWAGRIIGKSGSLSYMVLGAYDRNTPFDIPGEEESSTFSSDVTSVSGIGRLRYDFGDERYLGGMAFTRNFTDAHNYVVGIDWNYKFWSNWSFGGETFLSHTQERDDPDLFESPRALGNSGYTAGFNGEKFHGEGFHAVVSHSSRENSFAVVYNDFSPTYQVYNGLFSSTDYRQMYLEYGYTFYPQNSFLDRGQVSVNGDVQFNHAGTKKEQYVLPGIYLTLKGQSSVNLSYLLVNDERFRGTFFTGIHRTFFSATTRPMNEFTLSFNGQTGRFIHRSDEPTIGTGHRFSTTISIRPTSNINLSFSYDRARLSNVAGGELYYDGNIFRTNAAYQFAQEAFLRMIVQYNSFDKSLNLYPLFSYKLNAFTTFFAGITNDFLDYGEEHGFATTARQYFLKLQYLIRS